ncbi:hypothetical protein [Streptomyces sp. NPDC059168]|uniref:hypothetical protein n=1 Tax=Streptomyces sp. NPDC059168 TaxID=3346753 RepID=UPI00368E4337
MTIEEFGVIVAGARCAGSSTAMRFAQAGYRVLLPDRAGFPAVTRRRSAARSRRPRGLSTRCVQPPGAHRSRHRVPVDATGCPPLARVVHMFGDVRTEGCRHAIEDASAACAPLRLLLVRAATGG